MRKKIIKITKNKIKKIFKKRKPDGHKGDFGHTYVFAGSSDYVGAAYFASQSCVKAGSGLVTLFTTSEILNILKIKLNEVMVKDISLYIDYLKPNSLVFGCGMGNNEKTFDSLIKLQDISLPLVLDADGINALTYSRKSSFYKEFFLNRKSPTVLTPHYGEFLKLISIENNGWELKKNKKKNIEKIKKNRIEIGKKFAKKHKIILVLKDHRTLITDGDKVYINTTGNSSMSNGGMGDVLAGLIGSFISQGYSPLKASILAVYLHGKCGDKLSKKKFIVNPQDILENFSKLKSSHF